MPTAASAPVPPSRLKSNMTTSGLDSEALETDSKTDLTIPTMTMSLCEPISAARPSATIAWFSTMSSRIGSSLTALSRFANHETAGISQPDGQDHFSYQRRQSVQDELLVRSGIPGDSYEGIYARWVREFEVAEIKM